MILHVVCAQENAHDTQPKVDQISNPIIATDIAPLNPLLQDYISLAEPQLFFLLNNFY